MSGRASRNFLISTHSMSTKRSISSMRLTAVIKNKGHSPDHIPPSTCNHPSRKKFNSSLIQGGRFLLLTGRSQRRVLRRNPAKWWNPSQEDHQFTYKNLRVNKDKGIWARKRNNEFPSSGSPTWRRRADSSTKDLCLSSLASIFRMRKKNRSGIPLRAQWEMLSGTVSGLLPVRMSWYSTASLRAATWISFER